MSQNPTAVAGVAAVLEGLQQVAPQLYERLLQEAAPHLSPRAACERGDHTEVSGSRRVHPEICVKGEAQYVYHEMIVYWYEK